jgi:hypothetical protein
MVIAMVISAIVTYMFGFTKEELDKINNKPAAEITE